MKLIFSKELSGDLASIFFHGMISAHPAALEQLNPNLDLPS